LHLEENKNLGRKKNINQPPPPQKKKNREILPLDEACDWGGGDPSSKTSGISFQAPTISVIDSLTAFTCHPIHNQRSFNQFSRKKWEQKQKQKIKRFFLKKKNLIELS